MDENTLCALCFSAAYLVLILLCLSVMVSHWRIDRKYKRKMLAEQERIRRIMNGDSSDEP